MKLLKYLALINFSIKTEKGKMLNGKLRQLKYISMLCNNNDLIQ